MFVDVLGYSNDLELWALQDRAVTDLLAGTGEVRLGMECCEVGG